MPVASHLSISPLRDRERPAAVAVLARAFRDNPLNVAVIGDADPVRRLRVNAHGMRALLPVAQVHGGALAAHRGDRLVAALVATPPAGYPLPPPRALARLRCLAGQGLRVARRAHSLATASRDCAARAGACVMATARRAARSWGTWRGSAAQSPPARRRG